MVLFNFLKKGKPSVIIPEQQEKEQVQEEEQVEIMTFVFKESILPKQSKEKWQEGLSKEDRIRTVILTGWDKYDGDIVKKGDVLFHVQIKEKFASTIYASIQADYNGLFERRKLALIDERTGISETDNILKEGEEVFRIYKEPYQEKLSELKNKRFQNIPNIIVDKVSNSKEIKWLSIAGRTKSFVYHVIDDSFLFRDEYKHNTLMFTLHNIESKDFIIFRYSTKEYKLTVGSKISFLFNNDEKYQFEITNKPYKHCEDSSWGHIFETRVQLTINELECLKTQGFSEWHIELNDTDKKISGVIDSSDSQFAVNKLVSDYCELVQKEIPNYLPLQSRQETTKVNNPSLDECYIYLMVDLTNNYHKIGISNKPVIREKTLQSEKPTIEMICNKRFPNRMIAKSFEQALHKTYNNKRVRGEWFNLSEKEIQELKEALK